MRSWPTSASRARWAARRRAGDDRDRYRHRHARLHEPRAGHGRAASTRGPTSTPRLRALRDAGRASRRTPEPPRRPSWRASSRSRFGLCAPSGTRCRTSSSEQSCERWHACRPTVPFGHGVPRRARGRPSGPRSLRRGGGAAEPRITRRWTLVAPLPSWPWRWWGSRSGLPRISRLRGPGPTGRLRRDARRRRLAVPNRRRRSGAVARGYRRPALVNLEGIGQLRKIDPVTVLTGWRRMGGSASNPLTADEAREVGRRLGSR